LKRKKRSVREKQKKARSKKKEKEWGKKGRM
jgi:hypothetical protein